MRITGETMIFKNEKGMYNTTISNKKEDGTYENMRISVNFRKGIEIEDKTKINIKDGFLSFWKNKDGLPQVKLVIMDFEEVNTDGFQISNDESDLPF